MEQDYNENNIAVGFAITAKTLKTHKFIIFNALLKIQIGKGNDKNYHRIFV